MLSKTICMAAALLATTQAISEDELHYASYIAKFGKHYSTVDEFRQRQHHFMQTSDMIHAHNSQHSRSHDRAGFLLGHNQFSDMTPAEKQGLFGYHHSDHHETSFVSLEPANVQSIDWRAQGAVGPIRDEYSPAICQACWAFADASALESAHFIKSGELLQFSTQQLVDCDRKSMGCRGGGTDSAFDYYKHAPIMLE